MKTACKEMCIRKRLLLRYMPINLYFVSINTVYTVITNKQLLSYTVERAKIPYSGGESMSSEQNKGDLLYSTLSDVRSVLPPTSQSQFARRNYGSVFMCTFMCSVEA